MLDKTWIFYLSDNGFHMGAHRSQRGRTFRMRKTCECPSWFAGLVSQPAGW